MTFNFTYLSTNENDDNLYEYLVLDQYENNNIIVNTLNKEYKVDMLKNIKFCTEPRCCDHFLNYLRNDKNCYRYDQFKKYLDTDKKTFKIIMDAYLSSDGSVNDSYDNYIDNNFDDEDLKKDNKAKNNVIDKDTFSKVIKVIKTKLYYSDDIEKLNMMEDHHYCCGNSDSREYIYYSDILSITNK